MRLIDNPESLCAMMLKVKYFPDVDLMDATLKKKASYTWQSIMAGVEALKVGNIWRGGDGVKIKIWEDEWIPQSPTRKVITVQGNQLLSRVSDLINPSTGDWDEQLGRQTFWQVDAQRILSIPLPLHEMNDWLAVNQTRTGAFTVRSAYYGIWKSQFGSRIQNSEGPSNPKDSWDSVWSLFCPSKIIFLFGGRFIARFPADQSLLISI